MTCNVLLTCSLVSVLVLWQLHHSVIYVQSSAYNLWKWYLCCPWVRDMKKQKFLIACCVLSGYLDHLSQTTWSDCSKKRKCYLMLNIMSTFSMVDVTSSCNASSGNWPVSCKKILPPKIWSFKLFFKQKQLIFGS